MPSIYEKLHAAQQPVNLKPVWLVMAIGVGAALIVAAVIPGQVLPCITLAGAWAIILGLYAWMRVGKSVSIGESGERAALAALESLSDDYVSITNCKIPGYERIGDLDIVILGPHGVAVIEVKNFHTRIVIDGDNWSGISRHGTTPMKSVSRRLENEVKALSKFLSTQHVPSPVHGIIALNSNVIMEVTHAPAYPLTPYHALAEKVRNLPPARSTTMADVIERKLCSTATTN